MDTALSNLGSLTFSKLTSLIANKSDIKSDRQTYRETAAEKTLRKCLGTLYTNSEQKLL